MRRTAGWLALPGRALSAGFDGGISPSFQCVAAQLLGGWDLTETGLAPASRVELIWTHCLAVLFMSCPCPVQVLFRPRSCPVSQPPGGAGMREAGRTVTAGSSG